MLYARTMLLASLLPSVWAALELSYFKGDGGLGDDGCKGDAEEVVILTTTCTKGEVNGEKGFGAYALAKDDNYGVAIGTTLKECEAAVIAEGLKAEGSEADKCYEIEDGEYSMAKVVADPCFHSESVVTLANGTRTRVDALKEGDAIIAATAEGDLTIDTVSLLSISKPEAEATFVVLATEAGEKLTLTGGHHLPVGESCCSTLKKADDIAVGDKVWAAGPGAKAVVRTVAKKGVQKSKGLHSPVLAHGGFPVVDGVITSFDSIEKVTLAKHGLAPLIAACKATGTCDTFRDTFLGDDKKYLA